MSTTGDGDLAPGGQEGPGGAAGAQAGAGDGVGRNSEPRTGDSMPEAEAGGLVGASGSPREAALEGGKAEEDSHIEPAEEGEEEEQAHVVNHMVDLQNFSMTSFHLMVRNQMYPMLNRLYTNHLLVPLDDDHMSVRHQTLRHVSYLSSAAMAQFSEVQVHSDGLGEGLAGRPVEEAPAQEAEQEEEAEEEAQEAAKAREAEEAEETSLWETTSKESEETSLQEMPKELDTHDKTAECQDESSKEVQGTKSEGQEKKYNRKQEEPEKDLDPAKDRPRKPSLED